MKTLKIKRGSYGEIVEAPKPLMEKAEKLLLAVQKADKVDEHGGWEFGCAFDRKGRGEAINYSWYALGKDIHSKKFLAVIQIRKFTSGKRWNTVRKNYFLIGTNEDKTVFAHPIEARVIHSAIKNEKDVIKAVQDWMFDADYSKVIRQGDICLIPVKKKIESSEKKEIILQGSHKLIADKIFQNGNIYAENPNIYHLPATHPNFENLKGVYRVVVSKRVATWTFAKPTID